MWVLFWVRKRYHISGAGNAKRTVGLQLGDPRIWCQNLDPKTGDTQGTVC